MGSTSLLGLTGISYIPYAKNNRLTFDYIQNIFRSKTEVRAKPLWAKLFKNEFISKVIKIIFLIVLP